MTERAPVPRRLVVVTAGLSTPSPTRMLARRLSTATGRHLNEAGLAFQPTVLDLRAHATAIAAHQLAGFPGPELQRSLDALTEADGAIFTTPIFNASYSGLFKSFIDVIEPGNLRGLPVLVSATGGTERHSLAIDYALRPLLAYHHAVLAPTGVFAATSDWGSGNNTEANLDQRIDRAAAELAALMRVPRPRTPDPLAVPANLSPSGVS